MKRRQFLRAGAAAFAAAPALAAPALAQSTPEIKWRLTSSFGKTLDVMQGTVQTLCRTVAEATDNHFVIQPFNAGELAPSNQALDAVSSGSVECAFTPLGYYVAKDPVLAFGSGVPFGLNARQQHAWLMFGGGGELINGALKRLNVVGMPAGISGTQMGGWFRKEIATIDDFKGLRMRIIGMGGPVLARLGAVPYQMGHADVFSGLENGTLDGAEFRLSARRRKARHREGGSFQLLPVLVGRQRTIHMIINIDKWNELPKTYQSVLARACEAATGWMTAKYDYVNPPALRRLLAAAPLRSPLRSRCWRPATRRPASIWVRSPPRASAS